MTDALEWLIESRAQHDVVEWSRNHAPSWVQFWSECPRGDWMLGIAARAGVPRDRVLSAALACVPVLEPYLPEGEPVIERALAHAAACVTSPSSAAPELAMEVEALLSRCHDPAAHAATMAIHALLSSIDEPASAATFIATIVQAAVMDAGDCGMIQAARFTEHECARHVRETIDLDLLQGSLKLARLTRRSAI